MSIPESVQRAEHECIRWMAAQPEPRTVLAKFAQHYHYFSIHQVIEFTGLFRAVAADDRDSLAELSSVLSEELGGGDPKAVHSRLFERFVSATGVDVATLPLASEKVAPGVRAYIDALHESFYELSPVEAFAAYVFLEASAVETYAPLLAALRGTGLFTEDDLVFFIRHAEVEPGHQRSAEDLAAHYVTAADREVFDARIALLREKWDGFWTSLQEIIAA
jgi:pyrroloquinoline quinone (PQQ) biosynthesis protein C